MEAKETVQDKIRRAELQLGDDFGDEEMMEEAIFKAGIKEVVEWITCQGGIMEFIDMHIDKEWQTKLKEWGIKQED